MLLASSENGYISWRNFHDLYEEDTKRKAFLRMAPKITASALHPGNNKQKVALALAIFHETTIAAFKIYKPARKCAVEFLTLLSSWWAMIKNNGITQMHSEMPLFQVMVKLIFFSLLQNGLKTSVFQQVPLFAYLSKRLQL